MIVKKKKSVSFGPTTIIPDTTYSDYLVLTIDNTKKSPKSKKTFKNYSDTESSQEPPDSAKSSPHLSRIIQAKTKYMKKGKSLFVTPRKIKYKDKRTPCRRCL